MTDSKSDYTEPKTIWLEPSCPDCKTAEGRLWCEENVWDACAECGREAVQYLRAK